MQKPLFPSLIRAKIKNKYATEEVDNLTGEEMVMPSLGKSISLYLMDGTAAGRWQATLSNWNGIAYKIPRGMLKECFADLAELNAPGVYFLFGRDDSTWRQFIYIGEGDDVLKRLTQPHTFEKDGSYWTEGNRQCQGRYGTCWRSLSSMPCLWLQRLDIWHLSR